MTKCNENSRRRVDSWVSIWHSTRPRENWECLGWFPRVIQVSTSKGFVWSNGEVGLTTKDLRWYVHRWQQSIRQSPGLDDKAASKWQNATKDSRRRVDSLVSIWHSTHPRENWERLGWFPRVIQVSDICIWSNPNRLKFGWRRKAYTDMYIATSGVSNRVLE
jgi:hypothetical protein